MGSKSISIVRGAPRVPQYGSEVHFVLVVVLLNVFFAWSRAFNPHLCCWKDSSGGLVLCSNHVVRAFNDQFISIPWKISGKRWPAGFFPYHQKSYRPQLLMFFMTKIWWRTKLASNGSSLSSLNWSFRYIFQLLIIAVLEAWLLYPINYRFF